MKYILEHKEFSDNKPKVKIIIPDRDYIVFDTPIIDLEADIYGATRGFATLEQNFIKGTKFNGSKLTGQVNLQEGLNKIFVGGKSLKGITGWACREVYYKKPGPKITITNPSKETTETYDSMLSLEADIEDAKTVTVEHNGRKLNDDWISFKDNKLFVEKIYLVKGSNIIKVVAEDKFGRKAEEVKEILLKYYPDLNFTEQEREKIAGVIKKLVNKHWGQSIYTEKYIRKNNFLAETELLRKWFWNKKIQSFLSHKLSIPHDANKLIEAINTNEFDIFNANGKYFKSCYEILIKTSSVGNKNEKLGMMYFDTYQTKIGNTPTYEVASDADDTFNGIDRFALINGERYTIQIKTCENLISKNDIYKVKCSGDFKKITTDYLILAGEKLCFIIKVPPKDTWSENYFESNDLTNIVTFSKELLLFEKFQ